MSKTRVLIIDDDQSMLELAEFHLQARGYETRRAETGEQGLKLVEDSYFAVVLTDLQLPDLGGIEVVKRLKQIQSRGVLLC
jgi:CheY-like chemotaxis protein